MTNQNAYKPSIDPAALSRLRERLKQRGIRQREVAARAGVTKIHVCNVLAGRYVSAPVIRAAKELLAEARNGTTTTGATA